MLKIVIHDIPAEQRWVLSGKLMEPWTSELLATWESSRLARTGKKCVVDLSDVTFVEDAGKRALSKMLNDGAELITTGLYSKYLIDGLKAEGQKDCRGSS